MTLQVAFCLHPSSMLLDMCILMCIDTFENSIFILQISNILFLIDQLHLINIANLSKSHRQLLHEPQCFVVFLNESVLQGASYDDGCPTSLQ